MNEQKQSALQFPCDFPLKVMGRASPCFDAVVMEIVLRHVGAVREGAVSLRASSNGNYLSVTVTVQAESQDQLDNLYRELSGHERVLMVL
jgi:putative lipoic acid-binding regulatory protein